MNDRQREAYEWAKRQSVPSVAARYAKELAGLVDELLEDRETLRGAICVFCKENARLNGMLTGCASCRYGGAAE